MATYAICNQKGGVGKTTSTANLGAAFAERERRVLLCDLDPQGGLTTSLGFDPDTFKHTIYHVFLEECEIPQVKVQTNISGVDLVPSNLDLAGAEAELLQEIGWHKILPGALQAVQDKYDVILLDCPPSLGILTSSALAASDTVLVPLQCEYLSLRALKQLNKMVVKTRRRVNPDLDMLIFRTMYDKRTSHAKDIFDEIANIGGDKVLNAYIKRTIKMADASAKGQSLLHYDTHSEVSSAYRSLAQEIMTYENSKGGK